MLRIAALTGDAFLHDIARSALVGRYTSFPGYHLNTARTTVYEKPDFARRGKDELNSTTSIHYNHIWPHIALVLDYLVSDAFAKSKGAVDIPGRYTEGYGYLQQKIYGDRSGRVYDLEDAWLWMPRGVVDVAHPQLNYIVTHGKSAVALVLTNQSKSEVRSKVRFNPERISLGRGGAAGPQFTFWQNNAATRRGRLEQNGEVEVSVPPESIAAVVIRGVEPQVGFQREFVAESPTLAAPSVTSSGWRDARAVALSFGRGDLTTVYVYLPDFEREIVRCTLRWRQGTGTYQTMSDGAFPFDFTIPTDSEAAIEWQAEVELKDGSTDKSPVARMPLR
jgi:hypothetical protein